MVAVFNSMTFALKVTPLAVRALSEGAVAVKRFQVRLKKKKKNAPHIPLTKMKHCCVFFFSLLLGRCSVTSLRHSLALCCSDLAVQTTALTHTLMVHQALVSRSPVVCSVCPVF